MSPVELDTFTFRVPNSKPDAVTGKLTGSTWSKDFIVFIADVKSGEVTRVDRFHYLRDSEIFWEWAD